METDILKTKIEIALNNNDKLPTVWEEDAYGSVHTNKSLTEAVCGENET